MNLWKQIDGFPRGCDEWAMRITMLLFRNTLGMVFMVSDY
jgi:hypothetical protein